MKNELQPKEKVYIAGPITNDPDYKEKFDAVEKLLNSLGFQAINPIAGGEKRVGWTYKEYIDRGLKLLMICDKICVIEGQNVKSHGLDLERKYAKTVGIPRIDAYKTASGWLIG